IRRCHPRMALPPTKFILSSVRREVDRRQRLSDPRCRGQSPRVDGSTEGRGLAQRHHSPGRAAGEGDLRMNFTKPWIAFPQDPDMKVPVLDVTFRASEGQETRELFVVDSGADVSMATRYLCEALGLRWDAGSRVELRGIVPREECRVVA